MLHHHVNRVAVLVMMGALYLADQPSAQSSSIDDLIARGSHLISPQVRRADQAIPYLEQAVALSEKEGDAGRGATASARLGAAYRSTHQVDAALSVLERGAVLAGAANRPDLEGLCLRTIGNIHIEAGDYDAAWGYLDRVLAIAKRTGDTTLKIATLNTLSVSTRHQGRLTDALEHARSALQLLDAELAAGREVDSQPQFAVPFNVGKALADGGDYGSALEYFERAFAAAEANHLIAGVWHALFDTAEWYHSQGDLERAATYYQRALDQSRNAESRDMEANTIRGLAGIAEGRGELAEAIAGYTAALAVYQKHGFGAWVPSTMAALARAQRLAGRLPDAEETLAGAFIRARAQGQPLNVARVRIEMAAAAWARTDLAAAERYYEEARTIAAENGVRPLEAVAASGAARVVHARGDADRALGLYARAEESIRRLRARIPAPDQRATFSDAVHATFAGELQLLMDLARRHPDAGYDRQAFLTVERERTQDLTGALVESRITLGRELPAAVRDRQARIGVRLAEIQRELMSDEIPAKRRRALRAQQFDREREWDSVVAAHDHTGGAAADAAPAEVYDRIRETLRPEEAFVAYTPRWAFVVTRDGLRAVALPAVEGLATRVDFFVRLLGGDDPGRAPVAGRLLAAALIAPVQAVLAARTSRLIVSATGALAGLPFAALPDPKHAEAVPLVVRYEIAYAASATALGGARRTAVLPRPLGLLAIANAPAPVSRAQLATASLAAPGLLGALPYAEGEVERVAARASGRSRILTGSVATEYEMKRLPLIDFAVLHFATHALLDPVAPLRSAILLGAGQGEDGLLQAREIFQLPLSADLVVLSACRTAAGRASTAEGMQSLARAFLYAGARSVVGTLWDVDDRATARLMDRVYERAADGSTVAGALRAAQLEIIGSDAYRHAPQWAAFVIAGDGAVRVAVLQPTSRLSLAVGIIVLAGVLLALLLARLRLRASRGSAPVAS